MFTDRAFLLLVSFIFLALPGCQAEPVPSDAADAAGRAAPPGKQAAESAPPVAKRPQTPKAGAARSASHEGRFQVSDLHYLGAFRLPLAPPEGEKWTSSFAYGGTALAYHPQRKSLFLVGHDHHQLVAEVSIPEPVKSASAKELPVARVLQPFADVTGGLKKDNKIGGLLVDGDRLLWTSYVFYDAAAEARTSHGISTRDLSKPSARGRYTLADVPAGAVAGFMCEVPEEWRRRFGTPVLTGQAGIPIESRTSVGPVAVGFDPKDFGKKPTPATVFLYHPLQHPLARLDSKNELWNHAAKIAGMAFVSRGGKSALMFFGTRGLGEYWYGEPEFKGKKDPYDDSKGNHAPPYAETVWLYDPNDLLAVKNRNKQPWQVRPYQVEKLPGVRPSGHGRLGGAAYDPSTGRLYVSQKNMDNTNPYEWLPLIHVYQVGEP
jgi:hypothetical protein